MTERLSRTLLVILSALLIRYALVLPDKTPALVEPLLSVLLLATGLLAAVTALTSTNPVRDGRRYAVAGLLVGSAAGIWTAYTSTGPTTDAFVFAQYAGELLHDGVNPYAVSMEPALDRYVRQPLRPTYRVDGSYVTTYSYPAGSLLISAVGVTARSIAPSGFYVFLTLLLSAAGGVLLLLLPRALAALAPISLLAGRNLWLATAGGIIDAIWLLPLLAAMGFWQRDRLRLAGLAFGAAVAAKQQPWVIAPAALIVLWRTTPATERAKDCVRFAAPAVGVFLAANVPFVLANPSAWVDGVFIMFSVGKPALVQDGVGIVQLSISGVLSLSNNLLTVLTGGTLFAGYAAVWRYPRRLAAAIWLLPPVVLFWSPRSLPSYFTMFTPVAAAALASYTTHPQTDAR